MSHCWNFPFTPQPRQTLPIAVTAIGAVAIHFVRQRKEKAMKIAAITRYHRNHLSAPTLRSILFGLGVCLTTSHAHGQVFDPGFESPQNIPWTTCPGQANIIADSYSSCDHCMVLQLLDLDCGGSSFAYQDFISVEVLGSNGYLTLSFDALTHSDLFHRVSISGVGTGGGTVTRYMPNTGSVWVNNTFKLSVPCNETVCDDGIRITFSQCGHDDTNQEWLIDNVHLCWTSTDQTTGLNTSSEEGECDDQRICVKCQPLNELPVPFGLFHDCSEPCPNTPTCECESLAMLVPADVPALLAAWGDRSPKYDCERSGQSAGVVDVDDLTVMLFKIAANPTT